MKTSEAWFRRCVGFASVFRRAGYLAAGLLAANGVGKCGGKPFGELCGEN